MQGRYIERVRTTIDLPPSVLSRAKRLAAERGTTLSAVVTDALASHLRSAPQHTRPQPFELIVRGRAGARFATPAEIEAIADDEDRAALRVPGARGRATP
jgi:hypothetical protein